MSSYYLFNGNPVTLAYPVGGVFPYLGTSSAPSGYVLCDGASYNRFIYADLFAVIGYTYGGSNENFNVPDFRSKSLQGYNSGGNNSFTTEYTRASTDYAQTITIPTHSHNYYGNQFAAAVDGGNVSRTGLSGSTSYSHTHRWYFHHSSYYQPSYADNLINTHAGAWVRARHTFNTGSYMNVNPGSYLGNKRVFAMFYEDSSSHNPPLDSTSMFKTGTNTDGTNQSAEGGGGVPTPTYNLDFRQVSSTSITDNIGGLTATYNGSMSSTVSDGATFDGTDDYISFSPYIDATSGFSMEFYFYQTSNTDLVYLIDLAIDTTSYTSTADNVIIRTAQSNDVLGYTVREGTSNMSTGSLTFSGSTWIHCVITTNNSGNVTFYIDGSQGHSTSNMPPTIVSGTRSSSVIGGSAQYAYTQTSSSFFTNEVLFNGKVKYLRIFNNKELTASEVTGLYNTRENTDPFTVLNTAPHETRVNYIMNYGNLSNIEDALHIYSTDNTNYTEYTYNGDAYAIFDMTSNDSYFYMEFDSGLDADLKTYLQNNMGAHLLMVGGGGAGGGATDYLGGGGGAGALGISTSFNLPAEKTIYGKIGKGGVNGTSYSETHETTSQTYTGQEGHGADTILYIDGAMVGYAQGGGSGQDDTVSDTSTRWGGCAGGYSGTYTAQGSSNLSLMSSESTLATNVLSISTYGNISFQGNTNGASSSGYWASYPSFWWRGGTGGGGADSAGINFAGGPYGASTSSADGTNGGGAYTWIDGLEYAGGGGGGGNGSGGGGGAGDGGAVASSVASSTALLNSGADGQNATIANRGSGGGGGFTGGSGSDGVIKIAIPRDYILSVTQIPLGGLHIFTTHSGSPGLSWSGADNNTVRTYNGTSYTFFYFTDDQAETTTGTSGGGQGNQNNKFFIGTDPTLTPQQTEALNKIHGVEMLLIGGGGSGGYCGHRRGDSNPQGTGGGGGGAGGLGIVHNGNLPTNQYIKFLIGQQGDTSGKYASNSDYINRGYYEASDTTESNRVDRRARHSYMQVGTTESNLSTIATSYMGGAGAGAYATYGQNSGGYYQTGWISQGAGYQDGASSGGSTADAGATGSGAGGVDSTNGTYGTWNFYANRGGRGDGSSYGFGIPGGGGGAGTAGTDGAGVGGDGKEWIDGNTYCTGGGGTAGSNYTNQNTSRNGGSSNIHSNESAYVRWTGATSWVNETDGDPGPSNSGSGGGSRRQYLQSTSGFSNMDGAASGQGGSGLAVIAIPTSLIGNIYDYDTYNVTPTGFLEIKYTGYDSSVTESNVTLGGIDYTIFELPETGYTQHLSIGFKSGITALEKYKVLSDGLSIPFIAVGGGSSGEGLTGSPSGAGGSAGAVVYGNYNWNSSLTMSNVFEFVCNVGTGGAGSLSGNGRNAGGDTTIDLSGGYGLERYIDASGGEVDGSVGLATIKSLTHYGNNELNIELTSDNLPIAHYEFNNNTLDSSLEGNHLGSPPGFGYGAPALSFPPYTFGTFSNTNAVTPTLLTSLPITAMCWFQAIQSQTGTLLSFNGNSYLYVATNGYVYCFFHLGSWRSIMYASSITFGYTNWYHAAFTVDSNYTLKFYMNGSLVGSSTGSSTFQTNYDGSLIIGSKWDGNDKFYGYIGDVRVYNKELSATEISDIYNGSQVNYGGVIKNADYTKGADSLSYTGAGGAGTGGNGNDAEQTIGGAGGQGTLWPVEGYYYGAGGGGGGSSGGGAGGNSIGGEGADVNSTGTGEDGDARSATANRGSGGGGGINGAAGSSGVVKFAIPTSYIRTGGIGAHENSIATSNYLKIQTSGTVTELEYNETDYYLLDFQASSNLTTTTHYFKLGFVDDANDATILTYSETNYTEALTNDHATGALMLCVGGGGSGGFGSGTSSDTSTSLPGGTVRSWRIGGGGGAGGYVEAQYCATAINKLYTITVGAGGQGSYLDNNGDVVGVENKGENSKIELEGLSNPLIETNGGGVGCFDANDTSVYGNTKFVLSQGGSSGGRVAGFWSGDQWYSTVYGSELPGEGIKGFLKLVSNPYFDVSQTYRRTRWLEDNTSSKTTSQHQSAGSAVGSTFTSNPAGDGATIDSTSNYFDITNYGRFHAYGNPGGQMTHMDETINNRNNGNPYMSSCGGGGAGGPGYSYHWSLDSFKTAYGGQGKSWIDGSWYAAGGGGATMSPESFGNTYHYDGDASYDNSIQTYGTGGGSENVHEHPGTWNSNTTQAIIGGSGIRVMNAVTSGTTYDNPYHYIYAGYDSAYHSYQSNISRDGTAGTGSGGGGGFAHSIAQANLLMYEGGYTGNDNFSGTMFLSHGGGGSTDQYIYEGFNGSGGSGRVKIAIPKQINGVNIILASAQDTNYTGT